jgi:glycerophosphoryl diester phosphodiesterase
MLAAPEDAVTPRPFLAARAPLAFAHRGGGALWPENTLVAFRAALELGCRYVETDVHLTRDGEIVIFHDHRLERTTDGAGFVRDHTLSSPLSDAAIASRATARTSMAGKKVPIPTAEAVALDHCCGNISLAMAQRCRQRCGGSSSANRSTIACSSRLSRTR